MKKILLFILLIATSFYALDISFYEEDIKEALNILSMDSGEKIIYEPNISGIITLDAQDITLEQALDLILLPYNYYWTKYNGVYFVGFSDVNSTGFLKNSKLYNIPLRYKTASEIVKLLPEKLSDFILYNSSENFISVYAPVPIISQIANAVTLLDIEEVNYKAKIKIIDIAESYAKSFLLKINYSQDEISNIFEKFSVSIPLYGNYLNVLMNGSTNKNDVQLLYDGEINLVSGEKAILSTSRNIINEKKIDGKISSEVVDTSIDIELEPFFLKSSALMNIKISLKNIGNQRLGTEISTKISTEYNINKIIGVYSYEKSEEQEGGITFLKDLPIIGNLFENNLKSSEKRYVLFVLNVEEE